MESTDRARVDSGATPYVLLVEDETAIRAAFVRLLTRERFRVVEAGTAEEALERLAAEPDAPALLVTDVVMPGMGGKALVLTLRARFPDLRIVMMSGFSEDLSLRAELDSRNLVFLQKPFGTQVLLSAVRDVMTAS